MAAPGGVAWVCATLFVLAGLAAAWLGNGVSVRDAALYVLYVGGCVVLPGVFLALQLDRRPLAAGHFCVGVPLGLVQLMLTFVILATIGLRGLIPWEPLAVVGVCSVRLFGGTKPRWRLPARRPVRWEPLLLAAIVLVSSGLMISRDFAPNPLPGQIHGLATIDSDALWHIGNVAMLKEYWPPRDLRIVGGPLKYYIGDYLQAANTSVATGIPPETVVLRLDPLFYLAVIGLQLFWLGRLLAGRARAGLVASFLFLLVGDSSSLIGSTSSTFLNIAVRDMYPSQNYLLSLVFFLALVGVGIDWLRAGARLRSRSFGLLALLSLGATLTKAPVAFVLLGGSLALAVAEILARRRWLGGLGLAILAGGSYAVVSPLIHWTGQGSAVHVDLGGSLRVTAAWDHVTGTVFARFPLDVLPAMVVIAANATAVWLGVAFFLLARRLRLASEELWLTLLGAVGAVILFGFVGNGNGQFDFWYYGYVAFVLLAASGLEAFFPVRLRGRRFIAVAALAVSAFVGFASMVLQAGPPARAALARVLPHVPGPLSIAPSTWDNVTPDVLSGLLWLRAHTPARAVVAVNNDHAIGDPGADRYFYYSAFSERQMLAESAGYSQLRGPALARRQAVEHAIFARGGASTVLQARRRYDVSYLLADRRAGLPQPRLPRGVAVRVFSNHDITIYRVVGG